MTSVFDQYYGNLLADVAYADFDTVEPGQALSRNSFVQALRGVGRFSESQVQEIADRFEVVSSINTLDFAAVTVREKDFIPGVERDGFGREPGRIWIAFRGTEQAQGDFAADALLAFSGQAGFQDMVAEAYVGKILDPVLGKIVNQTTKVNLTGHSLGGHLALNAAIAFEDRIANVYTTNTANVGSMMAGVSDAFITPQMRQALDLLAPRIANIQADPGLQVVGSVFTGVRAGLENTIMTEVDGLSVSIGTLLNQHFLRPVTDAFEAYRVLAAAMPNPSTTAIGDIIRATSPFLNTSLEAALAPLWRILHPNDPQPFDTSADMNTPDSLTDDKFHQNAAQLFNELVQQQGTYQLISMVADPASLAILAKQDNAIGGAVRDALVNADPYAIVGADHSAYALPNFSSEYLDERAKYVTQLLAANSRDGINSVPGDRISSIGSDYYAEDTVRSGNTLSQRRVASTQYALNFPDTVTGEHLFGRGGDVELTGGNGNDFIFGGDGIDTLKGGAGNDVLDGGGGNDFLFGDGGANTLVGGNGFDVYRIAPSAGTTIIRDSDGQGVIQIEDGNGGVHSLGDELRGINGAAGMAVDPNSNIYRLSGDLSPNGAGNLKIKTLDGRVIIIEGYFSASGGQTLNANSLLAARSSTGRAGATTNDDPGGTTPFLGISMPPDEQRPPFPTTADYVWAPTSVSDFGGPGWFKGSGLNFSSFFSNSVYQYPAVNNHTELLDLSSAVDTTTTSHWYEYGSFGDSFIRGVADRSNIILDDFYQDSQLHVIGESVGNDIIEGGNASDYLLTHGGDDQAYGGGGTDIIIDRPEEWTEFGTVGWVNSPGHSNHDQLFGEAGNDLISANAGDGLLSGGEGGDLLFGGAGSDTLLGGVGDDLLSGDTKNTSYLLDYDLHNVHVNFQNLTGDLVNYGADILDGGDGQDLLIGGGGADTLYGGEGNDVLEGDLVILNPQGTWTWDNPPPTNQNTYSFATILAQHQFDPDNIQGADVIFGDGGDDFIFGGGLADDLHGGDGNDVVYGENQENGTASEATIAIAYHGADRIYGDAGNDTLYGNGGDDFIDGGDDDDVLVGDSIVNAAEIGNDELHGGAGADLIHGNGGNDTIYGDAGIDDLNGDEGDDTILGGDGNDNIHGDSGNDTLEGGAGTDAIGGDDGDDTLLSSAGGDSLFGGAGNDTYVLRAGSGATYIGDSSGSSVIRFDGGINRSDVRVEAALLGGDQSIRIFYGATDYAYLTNSDFDRVSHIEFSDGSAISKSELLLAYQPRPENLGDGKIHLNVDSASVTLHANGSDLLLQYAGSNGNWSNTADLTAKGIIWSKGPAADFDLGAGEVLVLKNWYASELGGSVSAIEDQSGGTIDLGLAALNLSRTQQATAATPVVAGNGGNDTLLGSDSGDILFGGSGNDTLDGGAGTDILVGEEGDDTYLIRQGSGVDVISDDQGQNVIRFKDGISSTDVAFHERSSGLEISIGDPANGNSIVIADWFDGADSKIEQFTFEGDNVTLSAAGVESRITGNRSPNLASPLNDSLLVSETAFSFSVPANAFVDPNAGDTLTYAASIGAAFDSLPSWLSFDPVARVFAGTAPAGTGSVDVNVWVVDAGGLSSIDTFTLTYAPALITGTPGNDDGSSAPLLDGSAIGERIEGLAGNDILRGNGGNDTLVGGSGSDILVGGSGNDTYLFNLGDGTDSIYSTGATSDDVDLIKFGPGIQPADVTFTRQGTDGLRIYVGGLMSSDYITIDQYFAPANLNLRVSNVQFQDSPATIINASQIDSIVLVPTEQADYLRGTNGADSIAALGGSDTVLGLDGDDVLDGGAGNDSIDGGAGNDTLTGGGGADVLTGGAGSDTYILDRGSSSSSILSAGSLSTDADVLRLGAGISSSDVRVERSGDALVLRIQPTTPYGSESVLSLEGDGNDSLVGQSVDELRFADQAGVVWTAASLRAKALLGDSGDNSIIGYNSDDVLRGGAGNDRLKGGLGTDTYQFGLGDNTDTILDSNGPSRIVLDAGITPANVTLYRSSSLDLSATAAGGDALVIVVNGGTDQIWVESFYAASGPTAISQFTFGNGVVWDDATIRANVTNLAGTANAVSGTTGNDSYVVDHPDDSIGESSGGGTDLVTSSVGYSLPLNVENLTLTGSLNIYGRGNTLANVITGNSGINYLYGAAGNDSLSGGAGNDKLDGGTGDDTLTGGLGDDYFVVETTSLGTTWATAGLQNIRDVVVEAAGEGTDTVYADRVYSLTMTSNVESLIVNRIASYSVTFNTTDDVRRKFIGNALDNVIDARLAENVGMGVGTTFTGNGAGGEIVLDGGAGADTLIGANLRTRFVVDNVNDVVIAGTGTQDTVETSLAYTLGLDVENLTLTGTSAVAGTGNAVANILDGSKNTGANVLTGGAGDDVYVLGAGDSVVELASAGSDSVRLTSVVAGTTYAVSTYANVENLSISGTTAASSLTGDANANVLTANTGANTLIGGAGNDTLTGDSGNDIYDAFSLTSGNDVIVDTAGTDTIRFDATANTPVSQLHATHVGNDLVLAVGAQSSIKVQGWYTGTTNKIESLQVYDQGLLFQYTGTELESSANGVNVGPRANGTDFTQAGIGQAFSYQLRQNMFLDLDSQNSLAYTAKLSDGSALPAWLSFNSATRTFSGTASGSSTTLSVQITATDAGGLSTTNSLSIDVLVLPIVGTAGDDVINGTSGVDTIQGLGGNDTLNGLGGNDSFDGGDGNDTIDGGTGADYMAGIAGNDIYYIDNTGDVADEDVNEGTDEVRSTIALDLNALGWANIENLTLLGNSAINGTGNAMANAITGNTANNTLTGGNGDDTLDGGGGLDTLIGGAGNDTYIVDGTNDVVTEGSSAGTDIIRSSVTLTTLAANVENVTLIGAGNIDAVGGSGVNILTGNSGNNALDGKAGNDTMIGGAGNDSYFVDSTSDVVTELAGEGTDTVTASVTNYTLAGQVENLILSGTIAQGNGNSMDNVITGNASVNTLNGNDGNDTLNGLGGNDTLSGGNGNDIIDGGAGNDGMTGGAGDDTFFVDSTTDTITEASGGGTDTIQTSVQLSTWAANVENMTLLGSSALTTPTTTSSANNVLIGNTGANTLNGGAGDDTFNGGANNDALIGGTGADIYQYNAGGGADTIDNSSADSLIDRLQFLDLASSQISFSKVGNNLVMTRVGVSSDTVTVTNWFSATGNRLDFVDFTNKSVTATEIDSKIAGGGGVINSIAPPAAFAAPVTGGGVLRDFSRVGALQNGSNEDVVQSGALESSRSANSVAKLGKQLGNPSYVHWEPIKTFLMHAAPTLGDTLAAAEVQPWNSRPVSSSSESAADIGANRLAEAMAMFGMERIVANSYGSQLGQVDPLEQLAAQRSLAHGREFGSHHAAID